MVKKGKILSKKSQDRLLGAYMPPQFYSYLSLYVVAKRTTKSAVFENQMNNWFREQPAIADLINEIAERISKCAEYDSLEKLKENARKELTGKGIAEKQIEIILNKVKWLGQRK